MSTKSTKPKTPAKRKAPAKAAPRKSAPKKPGRPSSYKAEYAEQAIKLCRLGATDKELGDFFDVSEQTINTWKKAHPEFLESIKAGKALADAEVADKLFKRATGYEHNAVKISSSPDGREHVTEFVERYPPDTTAMIFWLKNRRPDLWRDRIDNTHSGPGGGAIQVESTVRFVMPPEYPEDEE